MIQWKFQSTPSARRATRGIAALLPLFSYFNPRPPRGGRRYILLPVRCPSSISIHALREEGDNPGLEAFLRRFKFQSTPSARRATCGWMRFILWECLIFQSTPSARRATDGVLDVVQAVGISIHALREEGDFEE